MTHHHYHYIHLHVDEADPLLVARPGPLSPLGHHIPDGHIAPVPGLLPLSLLVPVHGVDGLTARPDTAQSQELVHQIQVGVRQRGQGQRLTPAT